MKVNYEIEELLEMIDFNEEYQLEVGIPNYLFTDLINLANKKALKSNHIGFTYSYIYFITYMARYAKYDKFIPSAMEIKQILGYTPTNKTLDYIMKRGGLLDENRITVTSNDFPIIAMYEDDEFYNKEFYITFASELYDDMKQFKNERKVSINASCKIPLFGFYQDVECWGKGESFNGTFFLDYDNTGIDFTLLDYRIFAFCMSYSDDLGCTAFYLYAFLKYQNFKFKDGYNATRKTISDVTGLSEGVIQKYLSNMRAYKMINVIHNMEYFSLAWDKKERKASSYKINEYDQFTFVKTEYTKMKIVETFDHIQMMKQKQYMEENCYKLDIDTDDLPY